MNETTIRPIAYIRTDFAEKFGIPRQSLRVETKGRIIFEPEFRNPDALRGIEEYDYLWLIFDFSENHREEWLPMVRPPRLGGKEKAGVFATRSPIRPNPLGLSCVKLVSAEKTDEYGIILNVLGADLLDGTPIFDIKPYIPYCDAHEDARGSFAEEHKKHRLNVTDNGCLSALDESERDIIYELVAEDPRPSYKTSDGEYGMRYGKRNIRFTVSGENAVIVSTETVEE